MTSEKALVEVVARHAAYVDAVAALERDGGVYVTFAAEEERVLDDGRARLDEIRAERAGRPPARSVAATRDWEDWQRRNEEQRVREARYSAEHDATVTKPPERR